MSYFFLFLFLFCFVTEKTFCQGIYVQLHIGECLNCNAGLETLREFESAAGRKYICLPEFLMLDSNAIKKKYNIDHTDFKLLWNDEIYKELAPNNALSKVFLIDSAGRILDEQLLKSFSITPIYHAIFSGKKELLALAGNEESNTDKSYEPDKGESICNLPIPGIASVTLWNNAFIIFNRLEGTLIVVDTLTSKIDTIALRPEQTEGIFQSLHSKSKATQLYQQYVLQAKQDPSFVPIIDGFYPLGNVVFLKAQFVTLEEGTYTPLTAIGVYADGRIKWYALDISKLMLNKYTIGSDIYALSRDSVIIAAYNENKNLRNGNLADNIP